MLPRLFFFRDSLRRHRQKQAKKQGNCWVTMAMEKCPFSGQTAEHATTLLGARQDRMRKIPGGNPRKNAGADSHIFT
jgi:hypothetical protein